MVRSWLEGGGQDLAMAVLALRRWADHGPEYHVRCRSRFEGQRALCYGDWGGGTEQEAAGEETAALRDVLAAICDQSAPAEGSRSRQSRGTILGGGEGVVPPTRQGERVENPAGCNRSRAGVRASR